MPPGDTRQSAAVNVRPVRAIPQNLWPGLHALPKCAVFALFCAASRASRCQCITCQSTRSGGYHAANQGKNRGLVNNQRYIKNRTNKYQPAYPAHQYYSQKGRAVIAKTLAQKKARQPPKSPGHDAQAHSKPKKPGCGRKGQPANQKTRCGEQNFVTQQHAYGRMVYAAPP